MANEYEVNLYKYGAETFIGDQKPGDVVPGDYRRLLEDLCDTLAAEEALHGQSASFNHLRSQIASRLSAYWYAEVMKVTRAVELAKPGQVERTNLDGYNYQISYNTFSPWGTDGYDVRAWQSVLTLKRIRGKNSFDKMWAFRNPGEMTPSIALVSEYRPQSNTDTRIDIAFNPTRDMISVFQRIRTVTRAPRGKNDVDWIKKTTERIEDGLLPNWNNFKVIGPLGVMT